MEYWIIISIHITNCDSASSLSNIKPITFGHRTCERACNHWRIVCTCDGDHDVLGRVVVCRQRNGVSDGVTGIQFLHFDLIQGVRPRTVNQSQATVATCFCGVGERWAVIRIHIADADRSTRLSNITCVTFGHRTCERACNHWRVVRTVDRDRDVMRGAV